MPAFAHVSDEYARLWDSIEIVESKARDVDAMAKRIAAGKARYQVVESATGVPWYVVGLIHGRESTCNFDTHLHNGDPLTQRTYHVPAGRPKTGTPPFDWAYSAEDALRLDGLASIKRWTLERIAYELEKFNGWGYRGRCPSPYLWSGTQHYKGGKYVADRVFDKHEWDKQSGTMAVLKRLTEIDGTIAPARESDMSMESPKANTSLSGSRTLLGLLYIKIGAFIAFLFDFAAGIPDIVTQAEANQSLIERGAALLSVNVKWAGLACVILGVVLALYARIDAHANGKVG
jgi:lysozyme family protein